MIFDTHMHTEYSSDSEMKLKDARGRAAALGLGVVITEHLDLKFPGGGKFLLDGDAYLSAYEPYRGDVCLLGVEIGMRTDCAEENAAYAKRHAFDYVIGSVHLVEGEDIYYESFYAGRTKQEVYRQYFKTMADCIRSHPFIDALGHIDYIARYARYADPDIFSVELADSIDVCLRAVVEQGIAMEINTKRLDDRRAADRLAPVYRRYRELGGKLATLGSDAHRAENIGKNFAAARALADDCGLKLVYFKNRKAEYMS